MRRWVIVAGLLLLGLAATQVFRSSGPKDDTVNVILAADRACEAQTGGPCD